MAASNPRRWPELWKVTEEWLDSCDRVTSDLPGLDAMLDPRPLQMACTWHNPLRKNDAHGE